MKNYQRGQILLIVVLVMTVALTIGLSIATRTITNVRTSTEEESSQRSFSAAEAGMEKALQELNGSSGSLTNSSTYQTTIATVSGQEILLNDGAPVLKDEAADLWLSSYPGYVGPWSGKLTVYWGSSPDKCTNDEDTNTMAALDIVLITGTKFNPVVSHYPVDPCTPPEGTRVSSNAFEAVFRSGRLIGNRDLAFHKEITVASGLLMRIVPLYASSPIGVRACDQSGGGCSVFPAQGTIVTSVGSSSNTQTKLTAYKSYPRMPIQLFPYIIFSPR